MRTKTSSEEREKLIAAGYVRVDGLVAKSSAIGDKAIKGLLPECRRWDGNNSVSAIAIFGEIWLGFYSKRLNSRRESLARELELERGLWVPCSNGESLEWFDLLERIADPDWNPPY